MEKLGHPRRRPWVWALLCSAILHAVAFLWLRHAPVPVSRPPPAHESVELTIEETPPQVLAGTTAPAEAQAVVAPQAPKGARVHAAPVKSTAQASAGTEPTAPGGTDTVDKPSIANPEQQAGARANEVPKKLDLQLHRPLEPSYAGGETIQNRPGEGDVEAQRPSLAQSRIDAWIEDDSARRRVEKGLVDDWFERLGRSLDGALARHAPDPPKLKAIVGGIVSGQAAMTASYGATGNPSEPSGPDTSVSAPVADMGPSAGIIPLSKLALPKELGAPNAPPIWAIIELRYGSNGRLADSKILSSSGDGSFNAHVLSVVAIGLPGLPDLPDSGLGIHPDGTRSVWEVQGHLTFERDLKTLSLKDDAWYLPIAAATAITGAGAGSFDETTGYIGFTDFRQPHLKCDVQLLQVY